MEKVKKLRIILAAICSAAFLAFISLIVVENNYNHKTFTVNNKPSAEQVAEWEAIDAAELAATNCQIYFENDIIKENTTPENIKSCLEELNKNIETDNSKKAKTLATDANNYFGFINDAENLYADGIVKSSISREEIDNLATTHDKLNEAYKAKSQHYLDDLNTNLEHINTAKNLVGAFIDQNNNIRNNPNRNDYNSTKAAVDILPQQDIKDNLNPKVTKIREYVEQQEEIARQEVERRRREEEERQRQIAAAWHVLNPPYHSQNQNGVYNGCEVTSLLMASQYKGYLLDKSVRNLADDIPKTDDPNTGFFLDIYGNTPAGGDAHWIAPAPLAAWAREYSGNPNVIDISGSSLSDLDREIDNGNPVIIYLTNRLQNPSQWTNGAPKNLHVILLIGYNSITNEQRFLNPWVYQNGQYDFTYSFDQANSIYEAVGRRAVVVR